MSAIWPWLRAALVGIAAAAAPSAGAEEPVTTRFPAPGVERAMLALHAATDLVALEPLVSDFQALNSDITVEYREYQTNDLFAVARAACTAERHAIDLVISSSVDHLVKLVNDGCALKHRSEATARAPGWVKWRDEVFGFTFEPATIVYNRNLVPPEDVPRTRTELIELLRSKPARYEGKIGSYDIAESGIGYLFASFDARSSTTYGRLLEAFGRSRLVGLCCTTDALVAIAEGRLAIAYNLLGSYAVGALLRGAPIGVVIPRDYALVLSRAAMVPKGAPHAAVAVRFVDYLLSERGQRKAREASFFFSAGHPAPDGVDGPAFLTSSGVLRPIPIGPELLAVQDRAKRQRFLAEWRRSTGVGAP